MIDIWIDAGNGITESAGSQMAVQTHETEEVEAVGISNYLNG